MTPGVWFAQVEAQFSTRSITAEKTKFDYVIASLAPDIATEVRDLILTPPAETPYTTLKRELIKRTGGSNQQKMQKLLQDVELGDRKPSQLLRRMRQLWSGPANDDFLRELFLQRLPSNVRMTLVPSGDELTLEKLADMADRILELATPTIGAVHTLPPQASPEVQSLRAEIRQLQELVKSMSTRPRESRHRSPTPGPRRSPSPARPSRDDPTLCWYHQRFGGAATKCRQPCQWGLNNQARR